MKWSHMGWLSLPHNLNESPMLYLFNTLQISIVYIQYRIESSLVFVTGAKPSSEAVMIHEPLTTNFGEIWSKISSSSFSLIHLKMACTQSWWRHQMETFSALLAICAGNSPVPGEFPAQRPVMRSFDVYFDLRLNKRLSKQSWGWWFETLSRPLWRAFFSVFNVLNGDQLRSVNTDSI